MTEGLHKQRENSLQDNIEDTLIVLRTIHNLSLTDIAGRIGVDKVHLNKISNKHREGSPLLLRALELLKEVLESPKLIWPDKGVLDKAAKRAQAANMTIEQFAVQCAILEGDRVLDRIIIGDVPQEKIVNLTPAEQAAVGSASDALKAAGVSKESSPSPQADAPTVHKPASIPDTQKRSSARRASPKAAPK